MLARIPFGLTTGPIEGAAILVAGCRKETVASEMRSNVLKYRDTLIKRKAYFSSPFVVVQYKKPYVPFMPFSFSRIWSILGWV